MMPVYDIEIPLWSFNQFKGCKRLRIGRNAYISVLSETYEEANSFVKSQLKQPQAVEAYQKKGGK